MSTNLNKLEYKSLLADSSQLAIKLTNWIEDDRIRAGRELKTRRTCVKLWQRHWRRTAKYNKLFSESRYVPEWYIAEMEQANEHKN